MNKQRSKYPKIAKAFKGLRAELDTWEKECTQDELAKKIDILKPQISELENGKREPSIRELKAYSRYFKVPMEYLLGISDSRYYANINVVEELGLSDKSIENLQMFRIMQTKLEISPIREIEATNLLLGTKKGIKLLESLYSFLFLEPNDFHITEFEGGSKNLKEIGIKDVDGNVFNLFISEIKPIMMIEVQNRLNELKAFVESENIRPATKSDNTRTLYCDVRPVPDETLKILKEELNG